MGSAFHCDERKYATPPQKPSIMARADNDFMCVIRIRPFELEQIVNEPAGLVAGRHHLSNLPAQFSGYERGWNRRFAWNSRAPRLCRRFGRRGSVDLAVFQVPDGGLWIRHCGLQGG